MLCENSLFGFILELEINLSMNNSERNDAQINEGKQIKYLRKKNSLTQADLASLYSVKDSALQRI
tara:strand:- start:3766 stop:3960 length:195 start_codon:yes stop_codon:yes gene_type:complete